MSHWRPVVQVDAFTTHPFSGNPAGVVPDAGDLDPAVMQRIAREMNVSETAFVLPSSAADWRLRWWTPTVEVPLCGHATVAACHALAEMGRVAVPGRYRIETAVGILDVELVAAPDAVCAVWLTIPIPDWEPVSLQPATLQAALQLSDSGLHADIAPVRGGEYMYVAVSSLMELLALQPDLRALELLGTAHDVSGWMIYVLEGVSGDSAVHARFFAPAMGIDEDPVTGSAQGPLGALLVGAGLIGAATREPVVRYQAEQGDAIGRPGRVQLEVTRTSDGTPTLVRIGGQAVTVLRGELQV